MINLHTRKCTSCGQEKPLTAFLILQKDNSKTYDNICATCRSIVITTEQDGSTTKGMNIDNKAKLIAERDQQLFLEEKEKLAKEAKEKRFEASKEEEKKDLSLSKEKILKKIGLDKTFIKELPKKPSPEITSQAKEQKRAADASFVANEQETLETALEKTNEEEVQRITGLEFTNTFIAPHTAEVRLTHNQAAQQFFAWVGTSANNLSQLYQKQTKNDAKAVLKPLAEKKYQLGMLAEKPTAAKEESLTKEMEKIWKSPSSRSKA
jgi:hypothetical protein